MYPRENAIDTLGRFPSIDPPVLDAPGTLSDRTDASILDTHSIKWYQSTGNVFEVQSKVVIGCHRISKTPSRNCHITVLSSKQSAQKASQL